MSRHTTLNLQTGVITELTAHDVAAISFQVLSGGSVRIYGTADSVAPTLTAARWRYEDGQGESSRLMAELFPGIAAKRVWAVTYAPGGAVIGVSHA